MNDFLFFLREGWDHIISFSAMDHILFIVALTVVYNLLAWKKVVILVTAFTIGHSITLALSVFNLISYSSAWIEFLIPCTIVVTGISNTFIKKYTGRGIRINYFFALFFGLIHGMGFASGLKSLLGKETSITIPLLGFNLGLEAGQIVVVACMMFFALIMLSIFKVNRRDYVIFLSGCVALSALIMALARSPF